MKPLDPAVVAFVRERAGAPACRERMRGALLDLVRLNTAPDRDLAATAQREQAFYARLVALIEEAIGSAAQIERMPLPSRIAADADYSAPGYALLPGEPVPTAEQIYRCRHNLFVTVPKESGAKPAAILHAHIDVVPPWFEPRLEGDRIYGRGACDNKAQVVVLVEQMRLLGELSVRFPDLQIRPRLYQFVLDEEIGGNGSVAASSDPRYAGLPVLMHDSTDLVPYCAHRGCLYYRCELSVGRNEGMTAVELFPFVVLSLEAEGRKIQRETNHPGFGIEHVQTNLGILGPYGEHPGSVCDHVAIEIVASTNANPDRLAMKLTQYLDEALIEYFTRYGDKSQERDASGAPKVKTHFDVKVLPSTEGQRVRVDVHGKSGHMAAVRECDNAITKTALLFGALLKNSYKFPTLQAYGRLADVPENDAQQVIVLEGGQGFTPSHKMEHIKSRLTDAATDAVKKYCNLRGRRFDAGMVRLSFDRLHNDAYAQSPDSAPMAALREACAALGHSIGPPTAWTTSCDARIYHHKGYPVAVFGAGRLDAAHSASEYIAVEDLQKALAISTLATLRLTATT